MLSDGTFAVRGYYSTGAAVMQEGCLFCQCFLEFYNPDKGRKTLNLTEKYKKQSAGSKENKKSKSSGKRVQK